MRKLPILIAAALLAAPLSVAVPAAAEEGSAVEQLKQRILERTDQRDRRRTSTLALPDGGAGNGIYQVYVDQGSALAAGAFTVLTGEDNAAGEGHNVLFGNGMPGTSYLIIRQTDGDGEITDWVQGQLLTHATERSLDDNHVSTEPIGSTGFVSIWNTSFGTVTQRVEVIGSTQANSRVDVSTTIEPLDWLPDDTFQVQYIWDVAVGVDDGPVLQELTASSQFSPYGPVITTEQLIEGSTRVAVVDNEDNVDGPSPALATAVSATGTVESMKYVCWPDAIYAEFGEYEVWDQYDVSTTDSECVNSDGDNDSAVVTVWPVGQHTVTGTLAMTPGTPYPTKITAKPVLLRLVPAFSATLRDTGANKPLAGKKINFLVGSSVRCSAVTDAQGVAKCGTLTDALAAVLRLGYTARFDGGAIWAKTTAKGGIA